MARLAIRLILAIGSLLGILALLNTYSKRQVQGDWPLVGKVDFSTTPAAIPPRPSAAIVVLCRNSDINGILPSLEHLELTFNAHPMTSYTYVFLNNNDFNVHFREKVTAYLTTARERFGGPRASIPDIRFGQIPPEHWDVPANVNVTKVRAGWSDMIKAKVPYASSMSYRQMCRFQSGFFFRHPLLQDFKYYWRVEPDVTFSCNIVPPQGAAPTSWDARADGMGDFFDPFRWMAANKKKYAWVLSLTEYPATIHDLWVHSLRFFKANTQYHSPGLTALNFVASRNRVGLSYNHCHFWSNFEIADLDWYRSEGYIKYFEELDRTGKFFKWRWGDAPVHSIAAAWLLSKDEIHQFTNIGYTHDPFTACPRGEQYLSRCKCDSQSDFKYDPGQMSCQTQWDAVVGTDSKAKILEINNEMGFPGLDGFAVLQIPGQEPVTEREAKATRVAQAPGRLGM